MYTRGQWVDALLAYLGNNQPVPSIRNFVIGWTCAEIAAPSSSYTPPEYNLLATTQRLPNSTNYNSTGVQNFVQFSDGIKANGDTIRNGWYTHLAQGLASNNILLFDPSPDTFIIEDLSMWVYGNYTSDVSQYIYNIYHQNYVIRSAEQFPGTGPIDPIVELAELQQDIASVAPFLLNIEKEIESVESGLEITEPPEPVPAGESTGAFGMSKANPVSVETTIVTQPTIITE